MTTIHHGDALSVLRTLPAESVQCVVTSPPYFGLRDYDVAGQLGLEARPDCLGWATGQPCGRCYVCRMLAVMREVRRVLRRDGTAWINMGDSWNSGASGSIVGSTLGGGQENQRHSNRSGRTVFPGLKPKDLIGMPWRLALAMQADGWWLRSDVIWHKPNPMPSSVKDRPTVAHEYLFLLTKSGRYHYDHEAVKEKSAGPADAPRNRWDTKTHLIPGQKPQKRETRHKVPGGWDTGPGAHGAFHREGRGDPEYREKIHVVREGVDTRGGNQGAGVITYQANTRSLRSVWTIPTYPYPEAHFATFPPTLARTCILAGCPVGGVVMDPFCGSGTTGLVARQLGRRFVGIELNPKYIRMAVRRIERETGLLGPVRVVAEKQEATA
ncbi:MAG: site-specific DNA-methyltransferase [Desulfovibrionaceae bacterium]|nr:site-specific DNA-methyltransferase [Desulfovibrionaceae bacterium]